MAKSKNIWGTVIAVLAIGTGIAFLRNKGNAYKNLSVNFNGLKFTGFSFPNIDVQLQFTINNNSNTAVSAKNIVGQLFAPNSNTQLGSFNVPLAPGQLIVVPANGNVAVSVTANLNAISSITSVLTNGASVLLKGNVTTLGVNIPFEQILKVG
jgi:hypothetical protein